MICGFCWNHNRQETSWYWGRKLGGRKGTDQKSRACLKSHNLDFSKVFFCANEFHQYEPCGTSCLYAFEKEAGGQINLWVSGRKIQWTHLAQLIICYLCSPLVSWSTFKPPISTRFQQYTLTKTAAYYHFLPFPWSENTDYNMFKYTSNEMLFFFLVQAQLCE